MIVAGCQIHYAMRTDEVETGDVNDFRETEGKVVEFVRPSYIYDADGEK